MTLENLKQNLDIETKILMEIFIILSQHNNLNKLFPYEKREPEKKLLKKSFYSLIEQHKIINDSIPAILDSISPFKQISGKEEKVENLVNLSFPSMFEKEGVSITIAKKDKDRFIKELSLSNDTIKRLKKKSTLKKEEFLEFKKSRFYMALSNKFFRDFSSSLIEKGYFSQLNLNLRKANLPFLLVTYLSMLFFTTLLVFFFSIFLAVFLLFFKLSLSYPFIEQATLTSSLVLRNILIIVFLPVLTFLTLYVYPYSEKKSIESKIDSELPFVVIHMSAIAGSGIEPTQIFKIIALSGEYPSTRKEFKKLVNQVNLYGYDLLTALKNVARETSSRKLAELFNGVTSSISGGTSMPEFLDKRAETLMFEYKLEQEKRIKSAETFMDIYVSIVVAAPMILTMLLVLMSVSGLGGLSISSLKLITILGISLINIIFMGFLYIKHS